MKALQKLEREVQGQELCTLCGSCVNLCPYMTVYQGKIRLVGECNVEEGACYSFCPRVSLDLDSITKAVFGRSFRLTEMGEFKEIIMARTRDSEIKARAQHGGVVSSMMCFALKRGYIDAAVLTKSENLVPGGLVAFNHVDVLDCSGSNFLASPTVATFNSLVKTDVERIGFVGTPCQVLALSKRKAVYFDRSADKLALTIGLFCTWTLSYNFRERVRQVVPFSSVKKMDIPSRAANVFQIYGPDGVKVIPLDEVWNFIRPACKVCLDMTNEFADISVGVARGMADWNTVVIRTDNGKKLIDEAERAGIIEIGVLPTDSFEHLKEASLRKKKRGVEEILGRTQNERDLLYLKLKAEDIKGLL